MRLLGLVLVGIAMFLGAYAFKMETSVVVPFVPRGEMRSVPHGFQLLRESGVSLSERDTETIMWVARDQGDEKRAIELLKSKLPPEVVPPETRVANLSLMQTQQNYYIMAGIACIAGILLFGFGTLGARQAAADQVANLGEDARRKAEQLRER